VGEPATSTCEVSCSELNTAAWPGRSIDSLLDSEFDPLITEPKPGRLLTAAGLPPAGLTTICSRPWRGSEVRSVADPPVRPG
jgi:hypothetical protein